MGLSIRRKEDAVGADGRGGRVDVVDVRADVGSRGEERERTEARDHGRGGRERGEGIADPSGRGGRESARRRVPDPEGL